MSVEGQIMFVGKRRAAIEGARSLGFEAVVVEPFVVGTVDGREAALRLEAQRLAGQHERPRAVVSAIERGVPLAGALREIWDLPGHRLDVAQATTDKLMMKALLKRAKIRCAESARADETSSVVELIDQLGLPMVVKPRALSGSRGTSVCRTPEEVEQALGPGMLAERWIDGEEMSLESWVVDGRPVWSNTTRYLKPGWANVVPAMMPRADRQALESLNIRVAKALGIERGITHLEVFRTAAGFVVGEIATRPPGGEIMGLMGRVYPGFDPWEVWVQSEITGTFSPPKDPIGAAGVWFLHPGKGRVRDIRGVPTATSIAGVTVEIRVEVGDEIGAREGVGQSCGAIRAFGPSADSVARDLNVAHDLIAIELE
jgi:hypothetical protein